jgi:hypothetical protein
MRRVVLIGFALLLGLGCHREPQPMHPKEGDLPPLPPASGTPIGYLIDASGELKLRDDQLAKLKDIDASLAARNASLDTQLRQYKHNEEEEQGGPPQRGQKPKRRNMAPGATGKVTIDENKLHEARKTNDREALKAAFALLDPTQREAARKLIEDHGFDAPGSQKKATRENDNDAGTPLPGEP